MRRIHEMHLHNENAPERCIVPQKGAKGVI